MCGRYVLYDTDTLDERYNVELAHDIAPNYNAAPRQLMPVITAEGLEEMRWGLIPKWAKDEKIGYKLFNARSESVFEKPMWRNIISTNRCLVPANGFYEWKQLTDGKHPYYIHLRNECVFSFAGIWETWTHAGHVWRTYSILTTTPNKELKYIHVRMPVILQRSDEQLWLETDEPEIVTSLLQPYTDNSLDIYEVDKGVNTTVTNHQSLIIPLNPA